MNFGEKLKQITLIKHRKVGIHAHAPLTPQHVMFSYSTAINLNFCRTIRAGTINWCNIGSQTIDGFQLKCSQQLSAVLRIPAHSRKQWHTGAVSGYIPCVQHTQPTMHPTSCPPSYTILAAPCSTTKGISLYMNLEYLQV